VVPHATHAITPICFSNTPGHLYARFVTVEIDPAAIETVRTSVRRLLAERGSGPLPFRMPDQLIAGWRAAVAICGEDFALRIASELPVGSFGRTSYAFASASSIGEALTVFCRDTQRAITNCVAKIEIRDRTAELTLRGPEPLWPIFELLLAIIALRCRQLVDPPIELEAVGLPIPQPKQPERWHAFFRVRPRFDLDYGLLALPAALLSRPLRTTDPSVRDALGTSPSESLLDDVRAHVRQWVRESPDAAQVARALGVSTRTLQRRLKEHKTSFRELVIEVKIDVAKQLLARDHLTIEAVSAAVGFARVASFSQAFSRRTGTSPSAFRAAHVREP
jgi:AraC-like DNA-binding protein